MERGKLKQPSPRESNIPFYIVTIVKLKKGQIVLGKLFAVITSGTNYVCVVQVNDLTRDGIYSVIDLELSL